MKIKHDLDRDKNKTRKRQTAWLDKKQDKEKGNSLVGQK